MRLLHMHRRRALRDADVVAVEDLAGDLLLNRSAAHAFGDWARWATPLMLELVDARRAHVITHDEYAARMRHLLVTSLGTRR
jgi:hypothetical protein